MKKQYIYFGLCLPFLLGIISPKLSAQESYEQFYKQAIEYFNKDEREKGYDLLNKAIGLNPTFQDALYARSYYLMEDDKVERALRDYDLLVLLNPEKAELYLYRGQANLALEQYEEAEEDYLLAYELDSTNTDILNALGSLYFILDDYEEALSYFEASLAQEAQQVYPIYYQTYTFYYQKKYDLALKTIRKAQKIDPKDWDLKRLEALIHIEKNNFKYALDIYEAMKKQEVEFLVEDFLHWGRIYYKMNNYADAVFTLETPEEHDNAEIYYYLAKTHYKDRDSDAALLQMNRAIELADTLSEDTAPFYYDRAVIHYRLRNLELAKKDYLYALYLMPEIYQQNNSEGETLELLADCNLLLKVEERDMLPKVTEQRLKGWADRSEVLISMGSFKQAEKQIDKALALDSTYSLAYTLKGTIEGVKGNYAQAHEYISQAQKLENGQEPERNYYLKSLLYSEVGEFQLAQNQINKAIELNAEEALYFSDRASFAYELGQYPQALEDINRAIALDSSEVEYFSERALYYAAQENYQAALEDCNRVISEDAVNIMAYYTRGRAYQGLKKYKKAGEDFRRVLEVFPEDQEVNQLLEEVKTLTKE